MNQPLRMTKQRRLILEELLKNKSHPSADEVYRLVRARLPNISLGTVYRNLELLSESGLIGKLELSGVAKRFDGTVEEHYHVRCVQCGQVRDVEVAPLPEIHVAVQDASGYEIFAHRLEFRGLCPQCRKRRGIGGIEPDAAQSLSDEMGSASTRSSR
ncbi:MAG: transcriptional repressor [Deltaproteobacteria bacterium]|nr:transcriptional repressor [Deltaproteobacteria bacterium]